MNKLSLVIPAYNEEKTLESCIQNVLKIENSNLRLELIIVDDCSTDRTLKIAKQLEQKHKGKVTVLHHERNKGKGAALRSGFKHASGDFVAVQDADLEYDPNDLIRLIEPLQDGIADVVLGSRFLTHGIHRVLYFWHSLGNRFLTFLSNMFTDLNLTDMETCYKVFKREIIQSIDLVENRFGFEPEIVAKISQKRLRIYEMGISYHGRTYEEGKKIGLKDAFRALYCIIKYNAPFAPFPIQFLLYLFIGTCSALFNYIIFIYLINSDITINLAAPIAFFSAAIVNYLLCILILFRHNVRWNSITEFALYIIVVSLIGYADLEITKWFISSGYSIGISKLLATFIGVIFNFTARKYVVFPEPSIFENKLIH